MSCSGGTKNKVAQVTKVLDSLRTAGAPDSLLTEAEVICFKAKSEFEKGSKTAAARMAGEAEAMLTDIRKQFELAAGNAAADLSQAVSSLKAKAEELSGERAAAIAAGLKEIDSLQGSSLLLQAAQKARDLADFLPALAENEEKTKSNEPVVLGTWVRESGEKDSETGSNSKKHETFAFRGDKTFTIEQSEKGNYSEDVVLDYRYVSVGTYSINGDTLRYKIDRVRGYNRNKVRDKKENKWVQNEKADFDSTVGQASQSDLASSFVLTVPELKQHFKRK